MTDNVIEYIILSGQQIGESIPDRVVMKVESIKDAVIQGEYPVSNIIRIVNGYSDYVKNESMELCKNYREVRAWLLKNVALVLSGFFIDPHYEKIGNIEEFLDEHDCLIKYLVKIQMLSNNPHIRYYNSKKLMSMVGDFLLYDYYLSIVTKSKHDIIGFILTDIKDHKEAEDESELYSKIKSWDEENLC